MCIINYILILENIYNNKYDLNLISHNAVESAKQFKWDKIAEIYCNLYDNIYSN